MFQAFHKRVSFDSVFSYNACSLTGNLLKGTHGEKTAGKTVEKQFRQAIEIWPEFKYESSFVLLLPFLIAKNSYFNSFALIQTIAEASSS